MDDVDKHIALLIDADNAPAAKVGLILAEIARYGAANIRRAYGDWKSPHLNGWESKLHEYAIQPMQQFAYSKGKNASDMAMVIDGMDLLHGGKLGAVAIVSSDADFTPLVMRFKANGLKVYGFGEQKAPAPFVNACSKFTFVEGLGAAAPETSGASTALKPQAAKELRGDTRLLQMIRSAIDSASGDDGWANLSGVGSQIANQASFDPRNYGYPKLRDLIQAIGLFDMKHENSAAWVKKKAIAKKVPPRRPRRPSPNDPWR